MCRLARVAEALKASGTDSSKHFTLRCGQVTSRSEAMSVTDSVANFRARATKVSVSSEVVDLLVGAGVDSLSKFAFSSSYYPGAADDTPFVRFVASALGRDASVAEMTCLRRLFH